MCQVLYLRIFIGKQPDYPAAHNREEEKNVVYQLEAIELDLYKSDL